MTALPPHGVSDMLEYSRYTSSVTPVDVVRWGGGEVSCVP